TRFSRDWSSDVCSSDLWEPIFTDAWGVFSPKGKSVATWAELNTPEKTVVVQKGSTMQIVAEALLPKAKITVVEDRNLAIMELQRSEERRVGKEGRSRWG